MFYALRCSARHVARALALSAAGGLMVAVGAGFLTVAAWILLATSYGTLTAAAVIGAVYMGVGLIFLGLAGRRSHRHHYHSPPPVDPTAHLVAQLAEGFLTGLRAGRRSKL